MQLGPADRCCRIQMWAAGSEPDEQPSRKLIKRWISLLIKSMREVTDNSYQSRSKAAASPLITTTLKGFASLWRTSPDKHGPHKPAALPSSPGSFHWSSSVQMFRQKMSWNNSNWRNTFSPDEAVQQTDPKKLRFSSECHKTPTKTNKKASKQREVNWDVSKTLNNVLPKYRNTRNLWTKQLH